MSAPAAILFKAAELVEHSTEAKSIPSQLHLAARGR